MDVRFVRYPALPVLHCHGYEPVDDTAIRGPGRDGGDEHPDRSA